MSTAAATYPNVTPRRLRSLRAQRDGGETSSVWRAGKRLVVLSLWIWGRDGQGPRHSHRLSARVARPDYGLVAADLLLIGVVRMPSSPLVAPGYGQDELGRRHRLAHIVLITFGYGLTAQVAVMAATWTVVSSYGEIILAVAATAVLTAVAISYTRVTTW